MKKNKLKYNGTVAELKEILSMLAKFPMRVTVLPDFEGVTTLNMGVGELAGIPAIQLRDAGIVEGDALALVETGAARCGLATNEARGAVKSAYRKPAREPITKERGGKGNGYKGPPHFRAQQARQ